MILKGPEGFLQAYASSLASSGIDRSNPDV